MKIWRSIGILLVGLLTAILIYPFLHESGHAIATLLVGGKVLKFQLFPIPFIDCELLTTNKSGMILIGLSGILFPVLLLWLIHCKNFWAWLIGLYLNFICFISFAISLYGCVRFINGNPMRNEDITKVLELCPEKSETFLIVFVALVFGIIFHIIIAKPLKHCELET